MCSGSFDSVAFAQPQAESIDIGSESWLNWGTVSVLSLLLVAVRGSKGGRRGGESSKGMLRERSYCAIPEIKYTEARKVLQAETVRTIPYESKRYFHYH